MEEYIAGRSLPTIKGTFLKPESRLSSEWEALKDMKDIVLVLTEGPSAAALAFKVWPALAQKVGRIVYAGGTLEHGDATSYAEKSIYNDPYGMESLINTKVNITFCTLEAARQHGMTTVELAQAYANEPGAFMTQKCGVHIETESSAVSFGRMTSDLFSDKKYEDRNCEIVF